MFGVGLEGQTFCVSCSHVIQVNGLVPSVLCPACGARAELTDLWASVAKDLPEMRRWVVGDSMKGSIIAGKRHLIVRRIRADVEIPDDLEAAARRGWVAGHRGTTVVRAIPERFAELIPDARYLLCEDPTTLAEAGVRPDLPEPRRVEGLTATCAPCGASIDLRGAQRLVGCNHCGATAFLSDVVWARLHPDRRPRRFFVWLDGEPVPERSRGEEAALARFDSHRLPPASSAPPEAAFWVPLELDRACDRCNGAIAIPAVVESVPCPTCQALHVITPTAWAEILIEACRSREEAREDDSEDDSEADSEDDSDDDDAPPPLSPDAARKRLGLDPDALDGAAPWVRAPPPFVASIVVPAGIELLMGEAPSVVSDALVGGLRTESVTVQCPQCGGALQPTGSERQIECSYCGVGLGLPDSVWRRLHPISSARFWMLYNPHAPVFEHDDLREAAGAHDGSLYLVTAAETCCRLRLYALDRALRRRWYQNVDEETSPSVGVAAAGPYVWWTDDAQLVVREFGGDDGRELRVRRVAVPEDVRVVDVDPDLRVLAHHVRHGHKGRAYHTLVALDLDTGACAPVWPAKVSLWRRVVGALAQNEYGPKDLLELSARPRWVPSDATVIGGPGGSVALVQGAVMLIYDREGSQPEHVDLAGDARTGQIRRCSAGWLVPVDSSRAALQLVRADGKRSTLLPGSEAARVWPGWPTRAEDGQIGVVAEISFMLYDPDGALRFESWRTRERE